MTTVADLVDRTRRHLRMFTRERVNTLSGSMSDSTTTCTLSSSAMAVPLVGDYIAIDYEVLLVTAVSTLTLTVMRGMLGTTAGAHTSAATVEVTPRFARGVVLEEIRDEIRSWPRDLYREVTVEVNWTAGVNDLELPVVDAAEPTRILQVARQRADGTGQWLFPSVRLVRGVGSAYPTGYGLRRTVSQVFSEDVAAYVTYAAGMNVTTFDPTTSVEQTVGLSATMLDIPPLGAAWRLLQAAAMDRTDTQSQGQTRKADEVKALDLIQVGQQFLANRDRRISDEVNRLRDRWGMVG